MTGEATRILTAALASLLRVAAFPPQASQGITAEFLPGLSLVTVSP